MDGFVCTIYVNRVRDLLVTGQNRELQSGLFCLTQV
jgi:hypothetical protein